MYLFFNYVSNCSINSSRVMGSFPALFLTFAISSYQWLYTGFKEPLGIVILPPSNILTASLDPRILKFVPVSSGRCPDTKGEP